MRFGIRETIFLLLLLAMPVAAYMFVFEPRNQQIAEAKQEIQRKQMKLQQLHSITGDIPNLDEEIVKLSEAIEVFEQKLPAQHEVDKLIRQAWELAARHNLTSGTVKVDKVETKAHYAQQPIRITVRGDFDGFYSFLQDLEKLARITQVPRLKLKKPRDSETNGEVEAELTLNIFFEQANGDAPGRGST